MQGEQLYRRLAGLHDQYVFTLRCRLDELRDAG
jgi:hypothetical protein